MRPFPFNLTGPEFLWFFAIFGLGVVFYPLIRRRTKDPHVLDPLPRITDPIQIATLRGGYKEAVRMLVVTLVDRGFVQQEGKALSALAEKIGFLKDKLEIAVFNYLKSGKHPSGVFQDSAVCSAGYAIEESLESLDLRVTGKLRLRQCLLSIFVFGGVAVARILISGPPFGFLLIEVFALIFAAVWVSRQGMTGRGARLLNQLRGLFARLKLRAPRIGRGSSGQEVALLAAVFGFSELPPAIAGTLRLLKPPADKSGSGCGSSGCGGGGGCGGGCGG